MTELAAFVSSPVGKVYGQVHKFWGTDPAAWLEPVDDILAFNLRIALATRLNEGMEPDEGQKHLEGMARAHQLGNELRRMYG